MSFEPAPWNRFSEKGACARRRDSDLGVALAPWTPPRRGLVQHGGLSRRREKSDRPVIRGPDHHLHVSPHRQHRAQRRGYLDVEPRIPLGRPWLAYCAPTYRGRPTIAQARNFDARLKARGIIGHRWRRHARVDGASSALRVERESSRMSWLACSTWRSVAGGESMAGPCWASSAYRTQRGNMSYTWDETRWVWGRGYGRNEQPTVYVVAIDFRIQRNILRWLKAAAARSPSFPLRRRPARSGSASRTASSCRTAWAIAAGDGRTQGPSRSPQGF